MPVQKKRRLPRWSEALILLVAGFGVFFSSCAAGLSGKAYGRTALPPSILAVGLLLGAGMFVLGAVVMLVVIVMTLVRAFSYQPSFGGGGTVLTGAGSVVLTQQEAERQVLWRLRVAIIVTIFLATARFQPALLLLRFRSPGHYQLAFLLSLLLAQAPYIFALVRTARRIERVGIAVAFATACMDLALRLWRVLGLPGIGARTTLYILLMPGTSLALLAEVFVVAFAWQAGRMRSSEDNDTAVVLTSFAAVVIYALALHWLLLPHLWKLMR